MSSPASPRVARLAITLACSALAAGCSSSVVIVDDDEGFGGAPASGGADDGGGPGQGGGGGGGEGGADGELRTLQIYILLKPAFVPAADLRATTNRADGSLVDSATTNQEGLASLLVPEGGTLSLYQRSPDRRLYTITIAAETTVIQLALDGDDPSPGPTMPAIAISMPALPGAVTYSARVSCEGSYWGDSPLGNIQDGRACPGSASFDLVSSAYDENGRLLAYDFIAGQPLPARPSSFALELSHQDFAAFDLTLQEVPGDTSVVKAFVDVEREVQTRVVIGDYLANLAPAEGDTLSLRMPASYGVRHVASATATLGPYPDDGLPCAEARTDLSGDVQASWRVGRLARIRPEPDPSSERFAWLSQVDGELGDVVWAAQKAFVDSGRIDWVIRRGALSRAARRPARLHRARARSHRASRRREPRCQRGRWLLAVPRPAPRPARGQGVGRGFRALRRALTSSLSRCHCRSRVK